MNELDLIRSFRADMPAPSAEASAHAQRGWRRAAPRHRRLVATWGRRRGARVLAGAGLVAAVTAAALILPSEEGRRLGTQPASAAETLRQAAAAQVGGVTRPLRPGEYWYVRRRTTWSQTLQTREDWVGVDGRRRWRMGTAEYRHDPAKLPPFYDGAKHITYAQLLDLPRDPDALYHHMRNAAVECECGNGVDQETFAIAGDLLRDNPIPVDLRAAILRAAALIPGIERLDHVRDVAGRPGVGVAFDGVGPRSVLIFDPTTYEMLGENDGLGGSADLESAIVGSINERP